MHFPVRDRRNREDGALIVAAAGARGAEKIVIAVRNDARLRGAAVDAVRKTAEAEGPGRIAIFQTIERTHLVRATGPCRAAGIACIIESDFTVRLRTIGAIFFAAEALGHVLFALRRTADLVVFVVLFFCL